jgi:hypothetical protein
VEVEMKKMSAVHDSHIQAGPPHQSSGEDQVIGVEDRGGTEGGSWAAGVYQGGDDDAPNK